MYVFCLTHIFFPLVVKVWTLWWPVHVYAHIKILEYASDIR